MAHAGFEVRPVRHYDAPRYPTTCLEPEPTAPPADERLRPRDVLRGVVCALLMLGLVLGVVACGDRARLYVPPPQPDAGVGPDGGGPDGGLPPPDGGTDDGGDIILGDIAECTPGDVYCQDSQTLMTCGADSWSWNPTDCDAHCQATYGPQSYSLGCDIAVYDPCNCYDMLDGGIAQCTPDMVECYDPNTVGTCDPTTGSMIATDCSTWCALHFGVGATATGCDATDPANPCGCVVR